MMRGNANDWSALHKVEMSRGTSRNDDHSLQQNRILLVSLYILVAYDRDHIFADS